MTKNSNNKNEILFEIVGILKKEIDVLFDEVDKALLYQLERYSTGETFISQYEINNYSLKVFHDIISSSVKSYYTKSNGKIALMKIINEITKESNKDDAFIDINRCYLIDNIFYFRGEEETYELLKVKISVDNDKNNKRQKNETNDDIIKEFNFRVNNYNKTFFNKGINGIITSKIKGSLIKLVCYIYLMNITQDFFCDFYLTKISVEYKSYKDILAKINSKQVMTNEDKNFYKEHKRIIDILLKDKVNFKNFNKEERKSIEQYYKTCELEKRYTKLLPEFRKRFISKFNKMLENNIINYEEGVNESIEVIKNIYFDGIESIILSYDQEYKVDISSRLKENRSM